MSSFVKYGEENMDVFESLIPITTDADAADAAAPKETAQTSETITRNMRLDIRNPTFPPIKALEFNRGAAADERAE
ncbi:MAG TPA: hypothetical protein VMF57_09145 [Solirubrobacteraceae bacterium]|nr:hypothetical protein [Solirubrobacteraceae bacterium]